MALWSDLHAELMIDEDVEPVTANRRAEPRYQPSAVPAITGVKTSAGDLLTLVNISATGVLVEGNTRIKPGERVSLAIFGLEPSQVSGRVVRSVVSAIGNSGTLRFQTGIAFDRRVRIPLPAEDAIPALDEPPTFGAEAVLLYQDQSTPALEPAPVQPRRRVVNRW